MAVLSIPSSLPRRYAGHTKSKSASRIGWRSNPSQSTLSSCAPAERSAAARAPRRSASWSTARSWPAIALSASAGPAAAGGATGAAAGSTSAVSVPAVVTRTVAVHPANLAASRARIEAADSGADSRSPPSSAMRIISVQGASTLVNDEPEPLRDARAEIRVHLAPERDCALLHGAFDAVSQVSDEVLD